MKNYKEKTKKLFRAINYFTRIINILSNAGISYIIIIFSFAIVLSITPTISVLIMQEIINILQTTDKGIKHLIILLILYVMIDIINGIVSLLLDYIENTFQMKTSIMLNMSILEKLKELSLNDFEDSDTYNTIRKAMNVGVNQIYSFFKSFIFAFQSLINVILFSFILFSWKWWIVPLILVIPLINTYIVAKFGKEQYQIHIERAEKERKQAYFKYLLTNDVAFKEIKLFDLGNYFRSKYKELGIEFLKQNQVLLKRKTNYQVLLWIFEQIATTIVFVYIILSTFMGHLLLGQVTAYTRSISSVKSCAQNFFSQFSTIYENMLYISQYFNFIDKDYSKQCLQTYVKIEKKNNYIINSIPFVEVKNLYYKYKNNDNYSLKNINLRLEGNSLVAFIGKNGSGKTTLVKILSTLYQDYQGDIYIGNSNLKSFEPDYIKNKIGILFQDFVKYELTVRENVAFGQLSLLNDSQSVLQALIKTDMHKKLGDLSMQLGFWFDDGTQLSGGEWLKVALSRAFIRNADFYLLDEPNAALDSASERIILKSIKELTEGKIGIIITHRIASVKNVVDKIIVFNNGMIEAAGTHEELLKISKTYKELYYNEL